MNAARGAELSSQMTHIAGSGVRLDSPRANWEAETGFSLEGHGLPYAAGNHRRDPVLSKVKSMTNTLGCPHT